MYPSAADALEHARSTRFRIHRPQFVSFFLRDVSYADNSGGVSILLIRTAEDDSVLGGASEYRMHSRWKYEK